MKFYLKFAKINRILRIRSRKKRADSPFPDRFHFLELFFQKNNNSCLKNVS